MSEIRGWLLDLYEDANAGLKLWLILDNGERKCFTQSFPVKFYAWGPPRRLHEACLWLYMLPEKPRLSRKERQDLFQPEPLIVLAIEVEKPGELYALFKKMQERYPDLTYYDADVQIHVRHAATYRTFPLGQVLCEVSDNDRIEALEAIDSRWELDTERTPLRVMEIGLDCNPHHQEPQWLEVRLGSKSYHLPWQANDNPTFWCKTLLKRHDPDILVTDYGDTWLLEKLVGEERRSKIRIPLNRDAEHPVIRIRERTYFSYGQIVHRGQQIHLRGRAHIDRRNAMMWDDYNLEGILETARVTGLPIQTAARVSPGTGISAMQMIQAMRDGILIPWHKQEAERFKTALDLIHSDNGGMVYQPTVGLHKNVGEIDFVSMYPSIMVRCNISPEKTPVKLTEPIPEDPGLIPRTLLPLLEKRVAYKQMIPTLPRWDPRQKIFQARAAAEKWLLVVCFGYLGYKNARFGRIEAHEAVTAGGREGLLMAKEVAEEMGYTIIQMYVDGLWLYHPGSTQPDEYRLVLEKIKERTGIPISLDGIFRWVAFLPSRVDERVPVANRYFGVFQNGEIKIRGLEARRKDTAPWIAETQMALIRHLAQAPDADVLDEYIPGAIDVLARSIRELRTGKVPLEKLLVAQKLSRELDKYRSLPAAARAARQLEAVGKTVRPGQRVRFLLMRGKPGVHAWDLPEKPDARGIDVEYYQKLMVWAAENIFQPMGVSQENLNSRIRSKATVVRLFKDQG